MNKEGEGKSDNEKGKEKEVAEEDEGRRERFFTNCSWESMLELLTPKGKVDTPMSALATQPQP